jgi:hypothetical protein
MAFDFLDDLFDLVNDLVNGGSGADAADAGGAAAGSGSGSAGPLHFAGYHGCFCGCGGFDGLGQICNLCHHPYALHGS